MADDTGDHVTWHCTGYLSAEEHDKIAEGFWGGLGKMAARRDHSIYKQELVNHRKQVLTPAGGVPKWRRNQHQQDAANL